MLNASFPERDRLRAVALPHLEARKLYDAALVVCQQLGLDDKVDELAHERLPPSASWRQGRNVQCRQTVQISRAADCILA